MPLSEPPPHTAPNAAASLRQRRIAMGFAGLLVLIAAITIPSAREPGPVIAPFLPSYLTTVLVLDLMTAVLFLLEFRQHGRASTLALACAYLFTGLVVIPHALTFPLVFSPTGLLGAGQQTSVWLWASWHGIFPLFLLAHALLLRREQRKPDRRSGPPPMGAAVAGTALLVMVLAAVAILGKDQLPPLIQRGNYLVLITSGVGPMIWLFNVCALAALWRCAGGRGVTELWLLNAALASVLDVTITLTAGARYSLGWYVARGNSLLCASAVLGAFLYEFYRMQVQLSAANRRLAALADTDALTGLGNRRAFDYQLAQEWSRAAREKSTLGLLILDIDQFKAYNDTYGHQSGDACLQQVAAAIRGALHRPSDFAARYGGEEMVVILPQSSREGALHVAEAVRAAIQGLGMEHKGGPAGVVTASVGAATMAASATVQAAELIRRADTALYAAKDGGRNRVHFAPD